MKKLRTSAGKKDTYRRKYREEWQHKFGIVQHSSEFICVLCNWVILLSISPFGKNSGVDTSSALPHAVTHLSCRSALLVI